MRDGGGIKPDVERKPQTISNLTYYLQRENRIFHFANRLRFENETMPTLTDSMYADFCREVVSTRRDTVLKVMKINLEHDLDSLKSEVIDQINQELALRYYFRRGLIQKSLEGDTLVKEATELLADDKRYTELLSALKVAKETKKKSKKQK